MSAKPNVLLIDWELMEIHQAVNAAAVLLEMLGNHQSPDEETERLIPGAALSVLHLVGERLKVVNRALHHDVDPRFLMAGFNSLPDARNLREDHAVILRPWVKNEPAPSKPSRPRRRRGGKDTKPARKAKP